MGIARLMAKGWVLLCLFAGAHAVRLAIMGGDFAALPLLVIGVLLFAAMGLVFVGGYGASAGAERFHFSRLKSLKPADFVPGFNEAVFAAFALLSFLNQALYAPGYVAGPVAKAFAAAISFAVFGHRAYGDALNRCALDGGRLFGSAFAWLLAIVFVCSAVSRLKSASDRIRLERAVHPEILSPVTVAAVLGFAAILAIQVFYVGSLTRYLPCSIFGGLTGDLLAGLAPLFLAYLVFAALAALTAVGQEK